MSRQRRLSSDLGRWTVNEIALAVTILVLAVLVMSAGCDNGSDAPGSGGGIGANAGSPPGGSGGGGGGTSDSGGAGGFGGSGGDSACGDVSLEPKGTLPTITLPAGAVVPTDVGSADRMVVLLSGYTVNEIIPAATLTVTNFPAVLPDGRIFLAAGLDIKKLVPPNFEVEHHADTGGFFLTLGDDGLLYTDYAAWCCGDQPNINCLYAIDPNNDSQPEICIAANLGNVIGGFHNLTGPINGYLYADIAFESGGNVTTSIQRIDVSTGLIDESFGNSCPEFAGPKAVDAQGQLFTVLGTSIYQVNQNTCEFTEVVCFNWPPSEGILFPGGLVVDQNGDFLFSEQGVVQNPGSASELIGQRIFKVDGLTGQLTTLATGLGGPTGIALDTDGLSVIVAEHHSGSLSRVDGTTGTVTPLADGNYTAVVWDPAFLPNDDLLVSQTESGLLLRATAKPNLAALTSVELSPYLTGFNFFDASAITATGAGVVYTAESTPGISRAGVAQISPSGVVSWFLEEDPSGPDSPNGVAVDDNGNVWVSNYASGLIEQYDSSGTLLGSAGPLNNPGNIVWHDGAIYVAEKGTRWIKKVDPTFQVVPYAGPFPDGSIIAELAFAPSGNLVVGVYSNLFIVDAQTKALTGLADVVSGTSFHGMVFENGDLFLALSPSSLVRMSGPFD